MKEPTPELLDRVAARFAALADVARLRLLHELRQGERRVLDLAAATGLAQPSVSKHLGVLRAVGLVEVRREGTQAWYGPRDRTVYDLCSIVCDGITRQSVEDHAALTGQHQPGHTPRRARR